MCIYIYAHIRRYVYVYICECMYLCLSVPLRGARTRQSHDPCRHEFSCGQCVKPRDALTIPRHNGPGNLIPFTEESTLHHMRDPGVV